MLTSRVAGAPSLAASAARRRGVGATPVPPRRLADGVRHVGLAHGGLRTSGPRVQVQSAGNAAASTPEVVKQELKLLETERDDAIQTAEHASRTVVRLTEMVELLERLALERVKTGDEEGARAALQEKASAKEALAKTTEKAQVNFALAARLAQKIGDKQNQLIGILRATGSASPGSSLDSPWASAPTARSSTSNSGNTAGGWTGSSSSSAFGSASYTPGVPKWQQSLEEAKERVRGAEENAQRAARSAKMSAEESVAAARERLAERQRESILEAKERLRVGADESIAQARERLRKQDSEVLLYVQRIMARYRRGEYVSEDELEFAFQQLEKRFLL